MSFKLTKRYHVNVQFDVSREKIEKIDKTLKSICSLYGIRLVKWSYT